MLFHYLVGLITIFQYRKLVTTTAQTAFNLNNCDSDDLQKTADKSLATSKQQLVCSGCYWSSDLEDDVKLRRPLTRSNLPDDFIFTHVFQGCGRLKNRLLVTDRNERFCARYRDNILQIQGEAYSYALAKLLHFDNVLPLFIVEVDSSSVIWKQVWDELRRFGWRHLSVVVLTPWIEKLQLVTAPKYLASAKAKGKLFICSNVANVIDNEGAAFLMQWTSMILFDYITGNLDRLVGHFYNRKWDKYSMHHPIHNLMQTPSGFLIFLDNESGFEHSYRLMAQYHHFHEISLKNLCVFRKKTIEKVKYFKNVSNSNLENSILNSTQNIILLPRLSLDNIKMLKQRLQSFCNHLTSTCEIP